MTDTAAQLIWAVGALVLVVSSLVARRLPTGQALRLLLIWIAIFAAAFVLFLFRDEGRAIWHRATAEVSGNTGRTVGGTYRIKRSDDGHFWAMAKVNGRPMRFLIDSGATSTTLSPQSAGRGRRSTWRVSRDRGDGKRHCRSAARADQGA